jgi:hypothetical protein
MWWMFQPWDDLLTAKLCLGKIYSESDDENECAIKIKELEELTSDESFPFDVEDFLIYWAKNFENIEAHRQISHPYNALHYDFAIAKNQYQRKKYERNDNDRN